MRKIKLLNSCIAKRLYLLLFMLIPVIILSACGNQSISDPSTANEETEETVTINNLDQTIAFETAPKRAITLNQHTTEVMLALGLEDVMVGTAYLDDAILPEYEEAYSQIPVLSEAYPSKEVFLEAEPDFAYGGFASAFSQDGVGSREELEELGIKTYLHQASNTPGAVMEDVYTDIQNIGKIFRIEDKAEETIDNLKDEIQEITMPINSEQDPLSVFVYDSGTDNAFTGVSSYLNELIATAGGENIFADDDISGNWTEVSWEEVNERTPEIIVIVDYGETSVEQKKDFLLNSPLLDGVPAIENERFVVLPLSAAEPGIRAPLAIETLVDGFHPEIEEN